MEQEKISFDDWKRQVKAYAWKLRFPTNIDADPESWESFFESGYSPDEAVRECMSDCE